MGNQIGSYEQLALWERRVILASWMSLRRKLSLCGQSVILIFLEDNPQHLQYFPAKYKGNPDLAETLGLKIMREFSRIIANLDAIPKIEVYLKEIAQVHYTKHVPVNAFDDFRVAFLKMIKRHFGHHRQGPIFLLVWDKLLRLVNRIICDYIDELNHKLGVSKDTTSLKKSTQMQSTPKFEPVPKYSDMKFKICPNPRPKTQPSDSDL